jgi:hypothetical protein
MAISSPAPSAEQWQDLVRGAMRETDPGKRRLRWTAREGDRWDLNGDCPHCGHYMSVLVGDVVASDSAFEAGALIEVLAACRCVEEKTADQPGCGAGRSDYIWVRGPQP